MADQRSTDDIVSDPKTPWEVCASRAITRRRSSSPSQRPGQSALPLEPPTGPKAPRTDPGHLLSDEAGAAWLAGDLPRDPIQLPSGTALDGGDLVRMPYSAVTYVALVEGAEEFQVAVDWISRSKTIRQRGGVPVVGVDNPQHRGQISRLRFGPATVIAGRLAQWARDNLWGETVEDAPWSLPTTGNL